MPKELNCPSCKVTLVYAGTKKFHEGTRWGALGDIGELFVKKEKFDVYYCPRCGKVDFFVDGIGEDLRSQSAAYSDDDLKRRANEGRL